MATYNYEGLVIAQIINVIKSQLTSYFDVDLTDLNVTRSNQPTSQYIGAVSDTKKYQVFITPISGGDSIGGGYKDSLNDDEDAVNRTYTEIEHGVYQIECYANYDSSDSTSLEGMDLAKTVRNMLMQQDTIEQFTAIGIYPENCTKVRPSFSVNNSGQYESTPSLIFH